MKKITPNMSSIWQKPLQAHPSFVSFAALSSGFLYLDKS